MRAATGGLLFFLMVANAFGQTPQVERIDVIEYGLFAPDRMSCQRDSRGVQRCGWINTKTTQTVPAEIGLAFGARVRVIGAPNGSEVTLNRDWLYPKAGQHPPAPNPAAYRMDRTFTATIGDTALIVYTLDNPWELVPGPWVLEFWSGDRKIGSQSFTMVKP